MKGLRLSRRIVSTVLSMSVMCSAIPMGVTAYSEADDSTPFGISAGVGGAEAVDGTTGASHPAAMTDL